MASHYILIDGDPVEVKVWRRSGDLPSLTDTMDTEALFMWADWYERSLRTRERIVARHRVHNKVMVSTVFLALDHQFAFGEEPVLYETMIFGGSHHHWQRRYHTREEAHRGHYNMLAIVQHCKEQGDHDHDGA